jgi:signal transduction histidine kinase
MKTLLIVLILIFAFHPVFAQEETFKDAENLLQELSIEKTDTARIVLKSRLSEAYRSNNPDTSLILANQALAESRELGFRKGEVMALNALCVLYREKGDLPNALQLGLEGWKIAEKENLIYVGIYSLIRVANVYLNVGDATKALTYLQMVDKLLEIDYDDFQWSVTQYFMAESFVQLNLLDSAESRVELLDKKLGTVPLWIIVTNRLRGNIAVKSEDWQQAITYYRRSYSEALATTAYREAATASNSMAQNFKKLGQQDSAIYYAKQGLEFGEMLSYSNRILAASSLLAELYAEDDPKEAVKYYQMALAAKDSLYGVQKFQQLQSATMQEQERQTEIEAATIAYRNNIRQWGLIGGVVLFLIVAVVLYRNNRQKQKANTVLQEQKQKVESTLHKLKSTQAQLIQSEKMASLGELTAGIAHEIQNPLNFVNNFSEVSAELVDEIEEERAKSREARDETLVSEILRDVKQNLEKINHHGKRADAIVKGMLEHSRTGSGEKELTDINSLASEYLNLAYQSFKSKNEGVDIKLITELDPTIPKIELVRPDIGKVLLNILNNAFYACTTPLPSLSTVTGSKGGKIYKPTILVSTVHSPLEGGQGGRVKISISDNGPGIPSSIKEKIFQPFFTTKPTGSGTGLGLSLSYDIIKAHGGKIRVESQQGSGLPRLPDRQAADKAGSEFIIEIPIT